MPGPVSGGDGSRRKRFGLESGLTQASFEILTGETPGEQLADCGVAPAEGVKASANSSRLV
jgi:hypothetical protein